MGRGLISGLIWGAFFAIVGVTVLSLGAPLPDRMMPADAGMDETSVMADMPDMAANEAPQQSESAAPQSEAETPMDVAAPVETPEPAAPASPQSTPASSGPISSIPLPAGSEFNRAPAEEDAALPGTDAAPSAPPQAASSLPSISAPPLPDTQSAPLPVATSNLQAPVTSATPEAESPATPTETASAPAPEAAPERLGLPQIETGPVAETETPPAGQPLQRLTEAPVVGAETEEGAAAPVATLEDLPAIEAFAAPFDESETRPLMAVILIDDGNFPLGRSTLTRFEFPVAFAIDPEREDAAEAAAEFRAAGFEVVLLADLFSEEIAEADVAGILDGGFETLPEAVAVLDSVSGVIQGNRDALQGVVEYLSDSGHGLVTYPRGLNVAQQAATRAQVPGGLIYRQIDEEQERATVITRYLDRAAFAAGQEDTVIIIGHTYSDTVTALFSWALGSRSEGVAIAPLSAVLTR